MPRTHLPEHRDDAELSPRLPHDLDADERARRAANERALGALRADAASHAPIQRREAPDDGVETAEAPPEVATGGASPLPDHVRARMEAAFRTDFSDVRIHVGGAAQGMNAQAFTQGNDIHFAPGQYQPDTQEGQELLAHELTHVVQQREGRVAATSQAKGMDVNEDESLEAEADELGARAARGEVVARGTAGSTAAAGPAQFNGFPTLEEAIDALSESSIKHILAAKHAWHLVIDGFEAPAGEKAEDKIPEGAWDSVKTILYDVAAKGTESKYKSVFQKSLEVKGQTVVLTFVKIKDGFRVSDAWVQTR